MSDWPTQAGDDENSFTIYGGFGWAQLDTQSEMAAEEYKRYKQFMEPYLQSGQKYLQDFNDLLEGRVDITQTPGYQAAFQTGMKALNSQLSARKQLMGGGALKSAIQFGHELGGMQYGEEFNRRMQAAYAAPPVAYGGHPGLSTLKELNEKYKYLNPKPTPKPGGGGGGKSFETTTVDTWPAPPTVGNSPCPPGYDKIGEKCMKVGGGE